ncbi:hypothetical protein JB92DRAFT_2973841, partial [Gautieria morchelliformis]
MVTVSAGWLSCSIVHLGLSCHISLIIVVKSRTHTSHTRSHQSPDPHQHIPVSSVPFLPTKAHTLHHFEGSYINTRTNLIHGVARQLARR